MATKNSVMKILVFVAKLKKPIIRKLRKMKVAEQYSYYDLRACEGIRVLTPLIQFGRMRLKKLVLLICRCFVKKKKKKEKEKEMIMSRLDSFQDSLCDDDSVDERAERFIQTFYQQLRNESSFQLLLQI